MLKLPNANAHAHQLTHLMKVTEATIQSVIAPFKTNVDEGSKT